MDKKQNIYTLNFWYGSNYGASLTAYALFVLLSKFNDSVFLVDNMNYIESIIQNKMFSQKFLSKYCKITDNINKIQNLQKINGPNNIFFTGSDQVFRPKYLEEKMGQFLLDFADITSKRVAVSASFGGDKEQFLRENSNDIINRMKLSLQAFDFISTREKSGVEICKDVFNVDAEWIIDPVFQIDRSYYDKIADSCKKDYSNKIACYIFDETKEHRKAYKYLEQRYNAKIEKLCYRNISIEHWLSAIKNSKLVITNSFHGMCFSIIFNKPFICLSKETGASSRFESLWELLRITNQSILLEDIYKKDCLFDIDYTSVNKQILKERERGINFIQKVLQNDNQEKQEKIETQKKYMEAQALTLKNDNTFKSLLWKKWLKIYYCYLPVFIKKIIGFFWRKIKEYVRK